MKGSGLQWAVVMFIAVAGVAFFIGFVASGGLDDDGTANVQATEAPTERPTARPTPEPTEYVPKLTGAEAASKAKTWLIDGQTTAEGLAAVIGVTCDAVDFNVRDRSWIVICEEAGFSFTARVFDSDGRVIANY